MPDIQDLGRPANNTILSEDEIYGIILALSGE